MIFLDDSWMIQLIPDQFKTQEMCQKFVKDYPFMLKSVLDWFVAPKMLEVLYTVENLDEFIVGNN